MTEGVGNRNQEGSAKFNKSDCTALSARSLKCISDNAGNNDACSKFFQEYKDCRKKEHDDLIAERLKRGTWG